MDRVNTDQNSGKNKTKKYTLVPLSGRRRRKNLRINVIKVCFDKNELEKICQVGEIFNVRQKAAIIRFLVNNQVDVILDKYPPE